MLVLNLQYDTAPGSGYENDVDLGEAIAALIRLMGAEAVNKAVFEGAIGAQHVAGLVEALSDKMQADGY